MHDVIVLCEGQTEREFCRSVVRPYIANQGVALAGTLVGKPQRKRGGIRPWQVYRSELIRLAKERDGRILSVLVDYYAMPNCWPGRAKANSKPIDERGHYVELELRKELADVLGEQFIPCVQHHEFETLLFVNPELSALSIAVAGGTLSPKDVAAQMVEIRESFDDKIERINDSPQTAPSKRILELVPGYDKVAFGVTATTDVGVDELRSGCPWLDRWLTQIEELGEG